MIAATDYHEATKHHPYRYARSLGYLDWATQPDPFRRYAGAPAVPLLLAGESPSPSYDALFEPGSVAPCPVTHETISELFQYSLALSAWKEFRGSRWALRINPSSGNLHPTEGYLVIGPVSDLADAPGVFHYAAKEHALERRCEIPADVWSRLMQAFPPGSLLVGLSSIHWREAWKYGERAYRYCQHDLGHALAAQALAAAVQGWHVRPLTAMGDEVVAAMLGIDRREDFVDAEPEHPAALLAVVPETIPPAGNLPARLPDQGIDAVRRANWTGTANRLSEDRVQWELIDAVAAGCIKPPSPTEPAPDDSRVFGDRLPASRPGVSARTIIRQRRSAVAMDGRTGITAARFFLMMDRVLPRFNSAPWSAIGPPALVDLALFVHRVEGLEPGLYALVRSPGRLADLRRAMRPEFVWTDPPGRPAGQPLYRLMPGDFRSVAGYVSCGQEIAADGAFSLGMIAEFAAPLDRHGDWMYRRLFWETGMIGQVLYLEAEAAGIRSTGIGCFFDDPMHDVLGLKDRTFQSLYHFTVGGHVDDPRLTTLPPYPLNRPRNGQPPA